jgi:hypothetical protein
MVRDTEKSTKRKKKNTVEPGIWREAVKNVKYEKYTKYYLEFGEKTKKRRK